MNRRFRRDFVSCLLHCFAASMLLGGGLGSVALAQDGESLKARHVSLNGVLANNPFHRPLHIESSEHARDLQGDTYAVIDQPYATVSAALSNSAVWCDILILHFNVKRCRASGENGQVLNVHVGRKFAQPIADTHALEFTYRLVMSAPDYFQVAVDAEDGPMGTSHYRIALEVVALNDTQSFLRLSYAYRLGTVARVATRIYLATIGRDKVGFRIIGTKSDGEPIYAGKLRGMVERTSMRYFLAIEAYLDTLPISKDARLERRLTTWYAATQRYPVQLYELERADYLRMKRLEIANQNAPTVVSDIGQKDRVQLHAAR